MPSKLQRLKHEALESAKFRGHEMTKFRSANHKQEWFSTCKRCGKSVLVMLDPPTNGIEIGGEAVALGCED